jgi:hypothetical protein
MHYSAGMEVIVDSKIGEGVLCIKCHYIFFVLSSLIDQQQQQQDGKAIVLPKRKGT